MMVIGFGVNSVAQLRSKGENRIAQLRRRGANNTCYLQYKLNFNLDDNGEKQSITPRVSGRPALWPIHCTRFLGGCLQFFFLSAINI